MSDTFYIPDPRPFWFVDSELLSITLRAEIGVVGRILEDCPELPQWFDNPETQKEQRKICFAVAARCKVMFNISDTIADPYEPSESLNEKDTKTIQRISNLIAPDAPAWALEMNQIVEQMPWHLSNALPEQLRKERVDESNGKQSDAIKSLGTLEQLQAFIQTVIDQQFLRMEARWQPTLSDHRWTELEARLNAAVDTRMETRLRLTEVQRQTMPDRRMNKRAGWQEREKLYVAIRKILEDDSTLEGIKFCAALDQRHAPPLHDWKERGEWSEGLTWKEAWGNRALRRKIRRVRQEAQKRR